MESGPLLTESIQNDTIKTWYDLGQYIKLASEARAEV